MGGFQLYERPDKQLLKREEGGVERYSINPGKFVRILELADVRERQLGTIVPCTTEEDIKDRGKSDGIAKAIVLLQTLWFVVQCITRGFQHLPLTELEIVTLAYAMMNCFIYFFWWDKPRDVGCPIRLYENVTTSYTPLEWAPGFAGISERMCRYLVGNQDSCVVLSKERKVPIFWSSRYGFGNDSVVGRGHDTALGATNLGPSIVGMAFGAVHFLAWWHDFLSHAEFILWRISCVALVAVPLSSTVACSLVATRLQSRLLQAFAAIAFILLTLSAWLYMAARVATIVIAFTALRSLPSDALLVVDWTTFIPHI
jgi:hypothetical protein